MKTQSNKKIRYLEDISNQQAIINDTRTITNALIEKIGQLGELGVQPGVAGGLISFGVGAAAQIETVGKVFSELIGFERKEDKDLLEEYRKKMLGAESGFDRGCFREQQLYKVKSSI